MNRFYVGSMLGGLVVYFLDPDHGEARRDRLGRVWKDNQETLGEARQASTQVIRSLDPLSRHARRTLSGGQGLPAAARTGFGLGALLCAAAAGAATAYFADPSHGQARRQRLLEVLQEKQQAALETGRKVSTKAADAVQHAENLRGKAAEILEEAGTGSE